MKFECSLNDEVFSECTSPKNYQNLTYREHVFRVRAVDSAGNSGSEVSHGWEVKNLVTFDEMPDPFTKLMTATFEFHADDESRVRMYECSLNGMSFTECVSPVVYEDLVEREHTFSVRVVDLEWARGGPTSYGWIVDVTPPVTTIDEKPLNPSNEEAHVFKFSSSEEVIGFECSLNGAEFASCDSTKRYDGLIDQEHTFSVRSIDRALNTGTPVSYIWRVDRTKPVTVIDERPADPTRQTTARFAFSAIEEGSGLSRFECRLNEAEFATCSSPKEYDGLTEMTHHFFVRSVDLAGNVEEPPQAYSWEVDTTEPETSINQFPNDPSNSRSARFEFSAPGAVGYECKLDGGNYVPCNEGFIDYENLTDVRHVFSVRARDAAGNVESTDATHAWTIDVTPPDTRLDSWPAEWSNNGTAKFRFSSTEGGGRYQCKLDRSSGGGGGVFEDCESPKEYMDLSDDCYQLVVLAIDEAGNPDPTPVVYSWTVDTVEPTVEITRPEEQGRINTSTPTITGRSEALSTVEISIDNESVGTGLAGNGGLFSLNVAQHFVNGPHSLRARATDRAGNESAWTEPINFIIDTEPPETEIIKPPPNPSGSRHTTFEVRSPEGVTTFECSLDAENDFQEYPSSVECSEGDSRNCTVTVNMNLATAGTKRVEGHHQVWVHAKDGAGNVDPTPAFFEWDVVITPPPPPTITEPQSGELIVGVLTIRGTATHDGQVDVFLGERSDSTKLGSAPIIGGKWAFTQQLEEGSYTMLVDATDKAENTGATTSVSFSVVPPKPQAAAIGGGLGCAASGAPPWLSLLVLLAGAVWRSRRRRA